MTRFFERYGLIALVSLLLVAGFLATSLSSYVVSVRSARQAILEEKLPLTSDTIYSEIQKDLLNPILVSSLMASDTFLRDWVLEGEQEVEKITRYLDEVRERYGMITAFFVSERTKTYYHADGVLKAVRPDEPRDVWYWRVRGMAEPYEINVDPDMANRDTMTIFINYRVLDYDGAFIGATGVGITLGAVRQLIDRYQRQYERSVYFVDGQGRVTMIGQNHTGPQHRIQDVPELAARASRILSEGHGSFRYHQGDATVLLNTRFIPELGWYLFVEQEEGEAIQVHRETLAINIALCLVITVLVLAAVRYTVNRYLSERANVQRRLFSMLSHEVRSPLVNIKNAAEVMLGGAADPADKANRRLARMFDESSRLLGLVERFLDAEALSAGSLRPRRADVALGEFLDRALGRFGEGGAENRVRLRCDHRDATVSLDSELVGVALGNLVENALRYAPAPTQVDVVAGVEPQTGVLQLTVGDQGPGMPEAEVGQLGTRYFRGSAAQGTKGTGLGLYVTRRIVEAHGGSLSVDSRPGQGATFTLRLPADGDTAVQPA